MKSSKTMYVESITAKIYDELALMAEREGNAVYCNPCNMGMPSEANAVEIVVVERESFCPDDEEREEIFAGRAEWPRAVETRHVIGAVDCPVMPEAIEIRVGSESFHDFCRRMYAGEFECFDEFKARECYFMPDDRDEMTESSLGKYLELARTIVLSMQGCLDDDEDDYDEE